MKCRYCNHEIPNSAVICPKCGSPTQINILNMEVIQCKACGAPIEHKAGQKHAKCEYCGTQITFSENENVEIRRIETDTYKEIAQSHINFQREIMQNEASILEQQQKEKRAMDFKDSTFARYILIFAVLFGIFTIIAFATGRPFSGIMGCVQIALLLSSWMTGAQILKEPFSGFHIFLFIIGIMLSFL